MTGHYYADSVITAPGSPHPVMLAVLLQHTDQTSHQLGTNVAKIPITGNICALTFGRKPKLLIDVESNPDIKRLRSFKEYYELLNKRIKYLQDILFNFKSWRLAMINKDRENFQYKGGDLVYIISPLTSQLWSASHKIVIKYVGPVVINKIVDPHNILIMTLDLKTLRGIF